MSQKRDGSNKELTRRKVLSRGLLGLGSAISGHVLARSVREWCGATPTQPEGPFYPVEDQEDIDKDLTKVKGSAKRARGAVVYVEGQLMDEHCHPIAGGLVEIWQSCDSGKYDHPADTNPAPLDPHFQYWGRVVTDSEGKYRFKTIKPGAYPASDNWTRPPHIHFKATKRGYLELITQMYFAGEPLNSQDRILQDLHPRERKKVVIPIENNKTCRFDLTLKKL